MENYQPEFLNNTLFNLQTNKKLSVGYFGGSVTNGAGASNMEKTSWRAITSSWLKTNFPRADVSELNASIGGIGSAFAMYRAEEHLIKGKAPDIVFVELAANDALDFVDGERVYDSNACYVNIETIVRKIYASNQYADIVFVLTGNYERLKWETDGKDSSGKPYVFGKQYMDIAEHYNIPVIRVGTALAEQIKWENSGVFPAKDGNAYPALWQKYANSVTDNVHPNDAGYRIYADTVIDWLSGELKNGYTATDKNKKELPSITYCEKNGKGNLCLDATMVSPLDFADCYGDFKIENTDVRLSPYSMKSTSVGDSIEFTFNSSAIGLWLVVSTTSKARPSIEYSIDGGETRCFAEGTFDGGNQPNKVCILASDLTAGVTHKIKITHTNDVTFDCRRILLYGFEGQRCSVTCIGK